MDCQAFFVALPPSEKSSDFFAQNNNDLNNIYLKGSFSSLLLVGSVAISFLLVLYAYAPRFNGDIRLIGVDAPVYEKWLEESLNKDFFSVVTYFFEQPDVSFVEGVETATGGDYDFLLVTKYPHISADLPDLELLRRKFRLQYHIEGHTFWKFNLRLAGKRIYWYETKFGSKVVYGNSEVLNVIPINNSADIDIRDGFSLLFNARTWCPATR
jgi:hypothetical protein